MDELKPCPFCGGTSVKLNYNQSKNDKRYYFVACNICGARTRGESVFGDEDKADAENKSVACWNQRAVNR